MLAPLTIVIAVVLWLQHKPQEAGLLIAGLSSAALIVRWVKVLVQRPRPNISPPLVPLPKDSSFPSAHTAQIVAFTLCGALIVEHLAPQWQLVAITLAIGLATSVAASRIYLQVHFPSDVLGGMLLAMATVWCVVWLLP